MRLYKFIAIFVPEKGKKNVYNVYVPALPGCLSFGESLTEAQYNIREAIELYLETLLDEGESIPKDRKVQVPKNALKKEITIGIDYEVRTGFESIPKRAQYVR